MSKFVKNNDPSSGLGTETSDNSSTRPTQRLWFLTWLDSLVVPSCIQLSVKIRFAEPKI